MIIDRNKGITSITYNHLNLPTNVVMTDGNIQYIYDAAGIKIKKIVNNTSESSLTTTEYAGNYIYENDNLQFFNTAEGYVEPNGSSYDYVYQYKDHLGNIRLSYSDDNGNLAISTDEIREENNYYPFGLKHKGYNNVSTSTNPALKYRFGGKEEQDELSLNSYDFGARFYNPTIGRWFAIDALSEKYYSDTNYGYALENPIIYIDPDGNQVEICCNWDKIFDAFNISIGTSAGVGFKTKVTKQFSLGGSIDVVSGTYNITKDKLSLDFLKINGDLQVGKWVNLKGGVVGSSLQAENLKKIFDGELPDFKSFTFLGVYGKLKLYKIVDAQGRAWVIKNDADKGWTFLDGDVDISAQEAFKNSDIGAEIKFIGKIKVGVDLGKLLKGILGDDETESESDSKNNKEKTQKIIDLINNADTLEQGTYKWDGSAWTREN